MFGMTIEIDDPLRGAAYRVLWEQHLPHACTSHAHRAQLAAEFDKVRAWLTTQDPSLREPYEWSMQQIFGLVDARLVQQALGDQVEAAFATIARPPRKEPS